MSIFFKLMDGTFKYDFRHNDGEYASKDEHYLWNSNSENWSKWIDATPIIFIDGFGNNVDKVLGTSDGLCKISDFETACAEAAFDSMAIRIRMPE